MKEDSSAAPKISYRDMAANPTTLYPVIDDFEPDALRNTSVVQIDGRDEFNPLYIVIEWDSMSVFVGYSWEGGNGWSRPQRGVETWFWASDLFAEEPKTAERDVGAPGRSDYESWCNDQILILKKCLACQAYLDSLTDADVLANDDVKAKAGKILMSLASNGENLPMKMHTPGF
jgi:hypothetical protein